MSFRVSLGEGMLCWAPFSRWGFGTRRGKDVLDLLEFLISRDGTSESAKVCQPGQAFRAASTAWMLKGLRKYAQNLGL